MYHTYVIVPDILPFMTTVGCVYNHFLCCPEWSVSILMRDLTFFFNNIDVKTCASVWLHVVLLYLSLSMLCCY